VSESPRAPLTAREFGERFSVTAETVLGWRRRGLIDGVRLPGTKRGRLRFTEDEAQRLIDHGVAGAADRGVDSYPGPRPDLTLRPDILPGDSYPRVDVDATTEEEP
jgi:hypothetical protein